MDASEAPGADDTDEYEPEEFDPDSLGPETPDVEPDPADAEVDLEESFEAMEDVDEELFRAFWGAAIFLNVAIAGVSIGLMLVYFRGNWETGGAAIAVGVVAALFTARYYFGYRHGTDDGGEEA